MNDKKRLFVKVEIPAIYELDLNVFVSDLNSKARNCIKCGEKFYAWTRAKKKCDDCSDTYYWHDDQYPHMVFSHRVDNRLRSIGVNNVSDIVKLSEVDLLCVKGLGKKSVRQIKDELAIHGLKLSPSRYSLIAKKRPA